MAEDPYYDAQGRLTRPGMEQIHAEGGSVMHKGRIIMPGEKLPTVAQLAGRDPEAQRKALAELKRRQTEIDEEVAELRAAQGGEPLVSSPGPQPDDAPEGETAPDDGKPAPKAPKAPKDQP